MSDDQFITMSLEEFQEKYAQLSRKTKKADRRALHHYSAVTSLLQQIHALGLPEPAQEYHFHKKRRWRFDLAWPDQMVACEVEGGVWMQTETGRGKGHAHPIRFTEDCEKYSEAAVAGWRLIRATPEQVKSGQAADWLSRTLERRTVHDI